MASERIRRYEQFGREYFLWTAKHDRDLHNTHSIADIGVVWGQRTQLFYKPTPDYVAGDAIRGMYTALLQGRFLFDLLHEDRLDLDRIRGYKAILLPGIAWLSDRQCAQLRAYVDADGSLLASFETSMFDEQGHRRTQFGLGDLFGTQPTGPLISKGGNSNPYYARIEKPHLVLDGFHDTNILPGSDHRLPVGTIDSPILTVVPGFPAYPPELSYPTQSHTNEPAIVLRTLGSSRVAYIPDDIERTLWVTGHTDLSRLLENTIRWVSGASPSQVSVSGHGLVEIFAWQTETGFALHLLNYTNPNASHGWVSEFYSIGPQKVRWALPQSASIKHVELLRRGVAIPFSRNGGSIEFTVPSVEDYEIVALHSR